MGIGHGQGLGPARETHRRGNPGWVASGDSVLSLEGEDMTSELVCWDCGIDITPGHDIHFQDCSLHNPETCEACIKMGVKCDCGKHFPTVSDHDMEMN